METYNMETFSKREKLLIFCSLLLGIAFVIGGICMTDTFLIGLGSIITVLLLGLIWLINHNSDVTEAAIEKIIVALMEESDISREEATERVEALLWYFNRKTS